MNRHLIATAALLALTACAMPFQGKTYLSEERYDEGIRAAEYALKENPGDFRAAFYLGRYHLLKNEPGKALEAFKRAVEGNPYNADYRFWTGIAHWTLKQPELEREAYLAALGLDARHVPSLVYLGHNLQDSGQWAQALQRYDEALRWDPYEPGALYNRAMVLGKLGREADRNEALRTFLAAYPDGDMARRAVRTLNDAEDFTYRIHTLGRRQVTLHAITFLPGSDDFDLDVRSSLDFVAAILKEDPGLRLHVVAYCQGNADLARQRAGRIRDYIQQTHPNLGTGRLALSWFGEAETIPTRKGSATLPQSVQFITQVQTPD